MPKLSAKTAEARRANLLDAARHCFAENGVHVSVDQICARAGISKGAFYGYFDSKDEALETLSGEHGAAISELGGIEDKVTLIEQLFEYTHRGEPNTNRLELEVWVHSLQRPRLKGAFRQNFENLRRAMLKTIGGMSVEEGAGTAPVSPEIAADIMAIFYTGLIVSSALNDDSEHETTKEALASLVSLLSNA